MAHLTEMGDTYERSKILLRETCVGNLATIWSEENAENVCEILWNSNQKLK